MGLSTVLNASGSDGATAVGRLDGALCVVFSGTGHGARFAWLSLASFRGGR